MSNGLQPVTRNSGSISILYPHKSLKLFLIGKDLNRCVFVRFLLIEYLFPRLKKALWQHKQYLRLRRRNMLQSSAIWMTFFRIHSDSNKYNTTPWNKNCTCDIVYWISAQLPGYIVREFIKKDILIYVQTMYKEKLNFCIRIGFFT
jgi:hypothetical protein